MAPLPLRRPAPNATRIDVAPGVVETFGLDRAGRADGSSRGGGPAQRREEALQGRPAAGRLTHPRRLLDRVSERRELFASARGHQPSRNRSRCIEHGRDFGPQVDPERRMSHLATGTPWGRRWFTIGAGLQSQEPGGLYCPASDASHREPGTTQGRRQLTILVGICSFPRGSAGHIWPVSGVRADAQDQGDQLMDLV
jgi:hypothetical protein